ncbi:uncharacterized protein QC761_107243 [Podospora bellae-mahoneyi]|uniref:Uncharacterized protein n=1 Tax=Podospora bellae-mahoneyi TaxID=2093777 RepID=A0ABR0FXY3_9PEZI|nr:hypothetical protein QC761_107243 [Podospora bellae-mahoneyi]
MLLTSIPRKQHGHLVLSVFLPSATSLALKSWAKLSRIREPSFDVFVLTSLDCGQHSRLSLPQSQHLQE